jgi:hypothetical protein
LVVDEMAAYEFLRAYLIMLGRIKDERKPEPEPEPEAFQPEPEVAQEASETYVKPRTRGRKSSDGSLY